MTRTVQDVVNKLSPRSIEPLRAPEYVPYSESSPSHVALAVPSMRKHMSDEGWQLMLALQHGGYTLSGHNLGLGTNVQHVIEQAKPTVVVVQDKREWDRTGNRLAFEQERFHNVQSLANRPDIFKLTVVKDSHQRPPYHKESAQEIGCHGWIIYYHPTIVTHLAGYLRPQHCIRTYHSLDPSKLPPFSEDRKQGCLLSGAVSGVYPLRSRLVRILKTLPETNYLPHPGYHNYKTATPAYLFTLSQHKVAICTSSIYGYALRKIIEATASGCVVITDLPTDDVLPQIDGNVIRLQSVGLYRQTQEITQLLPSLYASYDVDKQKHYAELAKDWYNYQAVGTRLANDIENLRQNYTT